MTNRISLSLTEGRLFVLIALTVEPFTGPELSVKAAKAGINKTATGSAEWADKHLRALRDGGLIRKTGMRKDSCALHEITTAGLNALGQASALEAMSYDGSAAIAEERLRQMQVEGWTPAGDDQYTDGQMGRAAMVYVALAEGASFEQAAKDWPWDRAWLKHDAADPARSLVKAGALIAAEYDRMKRIKQISHV